ncbi:hypothetical protein N658DRAFT_16790 [Parathielavia hyrcaniae]|uniref:Uncharacterized protein n=1 Tax=Parathielavia hyrcaniae TaxID=113614 RepID=A0AAN6T5X3_9PEZI|nr:hypothetical protein N658DRAFT_16790 [Parathielavia hyrcaniae]
MGKRFLYMTSSPLMISRPLLGIGKVIGLAAFGRRAASVLGRYIMRRRRVHQQGRVSIRHMDTYDLDVLIRWAPSSSGARVSVHGIQHPILNAQIPSAVTGPEGQTDVLLWSGTHDLRCNVEKDTFNIAFMFGAPCSLGTRSRKSFEDDTGNRVGSQGTATPEFHGLGNNGGSYAIVDRLCWVQPEIPQGNSPSGQPPGSPGIPGFSLGTSPHSS